jgi:hypothetical protein
MNYSSFLLIANPRCFVKVKHNMSGKPGRPNKVEQLAQMNGEEPQEMIKRLLNNKKNETPDVKEQIKAVASDLDVHPRTVSRYADVHLEYTCFWHFKGEKLIFASTDGDR